MPPALRFRVLPPRPDCANNRRMPPTRLSPGAAITRGMFAGVIVALVTLAAVAAVGSTNAFIATSAYLRMLYGFLAVWAIMAAMQRAAGDPGW